MHKRYKNQLLDEINTTNSNQSGDFWKLINNIRKTETIDESSDIPPESTYSSIKSCVKIDQSTLTGLFSCNKGIRQGDGLSPVLFSSFMNDLPQYFKQNNCPGVVLGNQSLNCLMYADDLLVISPSPEGLQQSLDVIHKHAQDWKLKVNTKKSNITVFSGNGQNKNKVILNMRMKLYKLFRNNHI